MKYLPSTETMCTQFHKVKPFFAVVFLQFGYAGMDILSKAALNKRMSNYVYVVYRHAIATIVMAPFALILDRSVSQLTHTSSSEVSRLMVLFSPQENKA